MKFKSLAILILMAIFLPLSALSQTPDTQDKKDVPAPAQEPKKEEATQSKKADSKPLSLEQILANYYKAIGGLEKWRQLNTMIMNGKIISQGVSMPITAYHQRPNKCRVEYRMKENLLAQVFNGMFAWQINPLSGNPDPTPMSLSRSNYLKDTCDIENSLIDYGKKGYEVKFMEKEEVGGKMAYKINVKYKTGNIENYYLDSETYLPIKSDGIYQVEGNELRTTTKFFDYKNTDGCVVPYNLIIDIHGAPGAEELRINKFIFNRKIDAVIFDFPKENIVNMQKKKGTETVPEPAKKK